MVRLRRRFAPLHGPICPDQQRDGARYRNDASSPNSPVAPRRSITALRWPGDRLLGEYYANTFPSNPFIGSPLVRTDAVSISIGTLFHPTRAFHR